MKTYRQAATREEDKLDMIGRMRDYLSKQGLDSGLPDNWREVLPGWPEGIDLVEDTLKQLVEESLK